MLGSLKMLNIPLRLVWCVPLMGTHFFYLWRTCGLKNLVHHVTSWMTIPVYLKSLTSTSSSKEAWDYACYEERQTLHQHLMSWWDWAGSHSIAHEVLSKDRCNPVLPNALTLAGKNNFEWPSKLHVVKSTDGTIILDHQIKTHDGWVAGVEFL